MHKTCMNHKVCKEHNHLVSVSPFNIIVTIKIVDEASFGMILIIFHQSHFSPIFFWARNFTLRITQEFLYSHKYADLQQRSRLINLMSTISEYGC